MTHARAMIHLAEHSRDPIHCQKGQRSGKTKAISALPLSSHPWGETLVENEKRRAKVRDGWQA